MHGLTALGAFLRRDWSTMRSYRAPFVLEIVSLFLSLALFFYFGRLVDTSPVQREGELARGYFAFAVIGLAVLEIGRAGLTSFAQRLRQEQTTGTFEALMATPTSPKLLILCSAAYDLIRATASSVLMILIGIGLFGLRFETGAKPLLTALLALLGTVAFFTALGVAVAAFTVVFKQTAALLGLIGGVLAFFGGVWFPTDLLPSPLRVVAGLLPFTWGLAALRAALLHGESDITHLVLLLPAAVLAILGALAMFQWALRRARRDGSMAQY